MQRRKKIVTGALLLFLVAAALFPVSSVSAASASPSDFQMKGDTLVKYTGTAVSVSIPVSVKHIGQEAFSGHTELKKVSIPAYVEDIAYNAFHGCTSLTELFIPDTVTEIGTGAFGGCSSLQKVTVGKGLKKLGNGVFSGCTSLREMTVSKDNKALVFEAGMIYSKDKKILYALLPGYSEATCKIPSSVKTIRDNAFWGCDNLKRVELGNNVTEIPSYAFANCRSLEQVVFSYSVYRIGLKAFADCISLKDVEIPASVREIHSTAFDGCPKLNIIAEEGTSAAEFDAQRDKSNAAQAEYEDILKTDDTETADSGQASNNGQQDTKMPEQGAQALGETAVVNGRAMVFIDNSRSKVLSGNDGPASEMGGSAAGEVIADGQAGGFPKYTIVNETRIAGQAYYGRSDLTEYEVPASIEEIGDFAFARSGLTSVVIPEGVTRIGYGAFYHCDNLMDITIPSTVTEIEPAAFAHTGWMEAQLEDRIHRFTVVGDGILVAYSGGGGQITIPEGVKQIGAEVFKDRTEITGVTLPDSLITVGEDAFSGCSSLTGVGGGNHLEYIKDRAFAGCPISTIKIPSSVKTIGLKAFDFSDTGKEAGTKIAVFPGKVLPEVSYEKTATRLINGEYRDAALKDVRIAIVDADISSLSDVKDTVLDYDKGGFRGFVCSVAQAAGSGEAGQLKIQFCVMHEEDVENVTIPPTVTVYGKEYEIVNPEDAVVYASEEQEEAAEQAGSIKVVADSGTLPDAPAPEAVIDGITEDYILTIKDDAMASDTVTRAFRKAAAGSRMTSLQAYRLSLHDTKKEIPVTRLGKQTLFVTIPKPNGISADNLHVVCTDADGQLEKVEYRIVTVDGKDCIQFAVEHLSVYGFYN